MGNLKIWHFSDTHTFHDMIVKPTGIDIAIFSGDCSNPVNPYYNEGEVRTFIDWYKTVDAKYKIYVAGNHDTSIEKGLVTKQDFTNAGIIYLEDESIEILGLNIFGSPWTPAFGNWAFQKQRTKLDRMWKQIVPDNTDILITHGPPKGVLDLAENPARELEQCGDKSLLNVVKWVMPQLHCFGHIHDNKGIRNRGTRVMDYIHTKFSNAACCTDQKFGEYLYTGDGNIIYL